MIKKWLNYTERLIQEIPPGDVDGMSVDFAYLFRTPDFQHIIFKPEGQDEIIIQSGIEVGDRHREMLEDMEKHAQVDFLWDLRFGLIWQPTSFEVDQEDGIPKSFTLYRKLYEEDLAEGSVSTLESAVDNLHRSVLFVNWKLKRKEELRDLE